MSHLASKGLVTLNGPSGSRSEEAINGHFSLVKNKESYRLSTSICEAGKITSKQTKDQGAVLLGTENRLQGK